MSFYLLPWSFLGLPSRRGLAASLSLSLPLAQTSACVPTQVFSVRDQGTDLVSTRTKVSRLDFCREESGIISLAGLWKNPDFALY